MTQRSNSPISVLTFLQHYSEMIAAIVCAVLVFMGWVCLQIGWLGLAFLVLPMAYVIGGYESGKQGLTTLLKEKQFDVDLLMIVAALGAAILGVWKQDYFLIIDGGILILIFAFSGALESIAMRHTERNIQKLMGLTPDTATVIDNQQEQKLPINQLKIGDIILVKPGERIPTDAIILSGNSPINQSAITGESIPVDKTIGDEVFAGTLNGNGVLHLKVHQPPESSLIQRVIQLVEQAQTEAPPSQQWMEKFERGYAKVIIIMGLALGILPPLFLGWDWETTIYRALIFLVVASPCALMASIMPALLSGIATGARHGILFKNGAQLEKIGRIKAIAFDKTGTLTTGKLTIVDIIPISGILETELLQLAVAVESVSEHPIGQAIAEFAREKNIPRITAINVATQIGEGIIGKVDQDQIFVGKLEWIHQHDIEVNPELVEISDHLETDGKTVVWVAKNQQTLGLIAVADTVRLEAKTLIKNLKKFGIEQVVMLTGDHQRTADSVAKQLNIDLVYANLLPEDKLTIVRQLKTRYQGVAMVGDGINDAPALALADVGIAMGGAGNDVALETADIVLMTDQLGKILKAIKLGRRANRIIQQNIAFALSFIVILLISNFFGSINMPMGVIGHEGSTVLVTLSGLRLLKSSSSRLTMIN
ncbi:Zinc-transporting ATPase [Planktothrix serta PCC 8927]|uniref:Zinc-transporting ATPase n=1 Tax=Planktothrix serta PCC 8927 TaxID=671068 RepID=A0A7Z9E2P9_9CYAN|nr:heavy metal translocating P-type ATPase [Planktothrix serta]VXD20304.1 Zinc-transporting ATPase [Planktothrix serta PCC 8927]